MLRTLLVLLFCSMLCACDSGGNAPAATASVEQQLAKLPATIEGDLIAGEGDEYDPALAHLPAAGSLTVGEEVVDVLIDRAMLKAAALPDDSGRVRLTLGEKVDRAGFAQYRVTRIERL